MYNPTLNRTKRTVLAAPTAADGPATFRALDKNDVGLGNVDNVAALPLTGGTMSGQIKRSVNTSHIAARDVVPLSNPQTGTSYRPVVGVKSANGYWVMSTYQNDNLRFAYTSDADYSAGTNRETPVLLPPEEGTIITSATIGNQIVAGVKDYNDGGRTIKIGFAGAGLTTSNLNYIAGYTDNGTKIKDVNKDVLKSWLGNGVTASGSNYVRFGDGTQICWGSCGNNSFSSFGAAFANTDYRIGMSEWKSGSWENYGIGSKSTTGVTLRSERNTMEYIAIGRWK